MPALILPDKTCRGCGTVYNRTRWRNGYLEGKVHYTRRVYCSNTCSGIQQIGRDEAKEKLRRAAPTETDLAYIAGIIDGEGSITVGIRAAHLESREVNSNLAMAVTVNMTDEGIIKWLQSATGLGRVHFWASRKPQCKDSWHWVCSVSDAAALLEAISPFLRLKKPQALLFLELAEIRSRSGRVKNNPERQVEIANAMQTLNKRGR